MPSVLSRARLGGAVVGAFAGGLVLASAFDRTPFGYAQSTAKPSAQDVRSLAEQSNAFVSIAESVTPAVVSISSERDRQVASAPQRGRQAPPGMEDFFRQFEPRQQGPVQSSGSGFIVSKDGYIMTNNHVVEGADRVSVTLNDRRTFQARVVGRDPTTDVAVIKIEGSSLPFTQLGNDEGLRVGEWVVAIGNPLDLENTVTAGIVSAKGRSITNLLDRNTPRGQGSLAITDFIQTDAAINPGNSGGPLVNIRGEVIGINSAIASPTGFYSGYGFAVPITLAREVMDDIIRYGRVRRAVLGVGINAVQPNDAAAAGLKTIAGVRVDSYSGDDSPAKVAGLQIGDIITAIDGKPVDRVNALQRVVRTREPGETVEVTVQRFGTQRTFKVRLAEAPGERPVAQREPAAAPAAPGGAASGKLGIVIEPVSAELAREANLTAAQRGVRVKTVTTGGPSYEQLFEGDVITEIINPGPRRPVRSVADLQAAADKLRSGQYLTLYVYEIRSQLSRVVSLRVGA
ncbi:MAG: HtrA protease/chaperone protein [uncultured Gemmatimonadaceae bacterium]|uniref:HtrA protease/chaperone protein n=1 Tax=uncultured Gemmatimonadaceae bacterium TaxID=246130 RepID=A0A6J4KHP3_9BACT|nr:MAG: HtrA protease/chaperone protein [uncultured Gemmatimonadaceae bacterium]